MREGNEGGFRDVTGVPGVQLWQPDRDPRIVLSRNTDAPVYTQEEESRWEVLCAANPRVHDGPILSVEGIDHGAAVIRCRRDRYKRLAVQDGSRPPPEGAWLLGVKGWITARDARGVEHLLIARRGRETRVYAGMWESAPAGGVESPREGIGELSIESLAQTLEAEAEEELGMELDARAARAAGVCRDFTAGSDDIFLHVELPVVIDPRRAPRCPQGRCGWEYIDSAWLARIDAPAFEAGGAIVGPTRAMLRAMGWVGETALDI